MYKKVASMVLIMAVLFSLVAVSTVSADTTGNSIQAEQEREANVLKNLGLFAGTNNGFELDRAPTRTEAIVLLLRMLGVAQEALDSNYTHTFKDVPTWADKYIAYAYNKGLTGGYSKTTFGGNDNATPEQFLTFTLRALGYSDKNGDFTFKDAIKFAESKGLAVAGKYKAGAKNFTRGDCVDIIYKALSVTKKVEKVTLAESLVNSSVIDGAKAESYGLYSVYKKIRVPLRKDPQTGEMTLFLADVIKQVPGAKYGTLFYGGGISNLTDYEKAFDQELIKIYNALTNPNKSVELVDYLTNSYAAPSTYSGPVTILFCAVYDENANVLAESISNWRDVAANNYMDFALVNISLKGLVDAREAKFSELFGNPVESPNAITTIEKAKIHAVLIDSKTGKVKQEFTNDTYAYRYVFDSNKYPELAGKIKGFSEFAIPAGMSVVPAGMSALDVIKQDCKFRMGFADFKGSFTGVYNFTNYEEYTNQWTQHESDWGIKRYIVFDDGNKPIAYTTIIPSQLKVVDVGKIKAEIYIDYGTNKEIKRVYTKE